MSYTMTHIYIADKVAENLSGIKNYSTYLLGSIAPDAVHASDSYIVEDKERSHLFVEGLKWGKITNVNQVDKWEKSIRNYYALNKDKYDRDFLTGYMVHLFSDVYSSIKFFYPFVSSIKVDFDKEKEHFFKENFGYNYYLFLEYEKNHNLRKLMEEAACETLEGVITAELIKRRIELLFKQEFTDRDISDIDTYTICSHEAMKRLIEGSTEYVTEEIKKLI